MDKSENWNKKRVESFGKPAVKSVYAAMAERITVDWRTRGNRELTFLDLGTGTGYLLVALKELFPDAKAIGVDPSEEMLRLARKNVDESGHSNIELRPGRAEKIPADSESIDLLMTQFSLHEWEDPEKGFAEISRVLKPDGTVVIRAWNKSCPRFEFWKHNIEHIFKFGWNRAKEARKSHKRSYPFQMVVDLVRAHNMKPVETEERVQLFIKARLL